MMNNVKIVSYNKALYIKNTIGAEFVTLVTKKDFLSGDYHQPTPLIVVYEDKQDVAI